MCKTTSRVLLSALIAAAVSLALTNSVTPYTHTDPNGPYLPPCESDGPDGGPACYWDASERGNGLGNDFVYIP